MDFERDMGGTSVMVCIDGGTFFLTLEKYRENWRLYMNTMMLNDSIRKIVTTDVTFF